MELRNTRKSSIEHVVFPVDLRLAAAELYIISNVHNV
jgi:hypothetical protein